jgi:predicted metal-dependent phosphoesterase TrpH
MRIRGALHVHSRLSRDGTLTIAELAAWYRQHSYEFVALGEHAEDLDEAKASALRRLAADNSGPQFCMIPGIEYVCTGDIHIVGIGAAQLIAERDPLRVIEMIHRQEGMAILAHPKRIAWKCPSDILLAVDAAEIWNINYDGKYLPSARSIGGFRDMQEINPKLLAVAGHDFHRIASFYDVRIEMNVPQLFREMILRDMKKGNYAIKSNFFNLGPQAHFSRAQEASVRLFSPQLSNLRKARSFFIRHAT